MSNRAIKMFYELKDANTGESLEQSLSNELAFISGQNQIIPKLEEAVLDLEAGQKSEILLSCADALGEVREELIQEIEKEQFEGIDLKVGMELFGQNPDGSHVRVIVKEVQDDKVLVDFNHPYAGKDLLFSVEITENREASEEEKKSGIVEGMAHGCACSHGDDGDCCGGGHKHEHGHEHQCCGKHKH